MHRNRTERERSETQTQRGKNIRKNRKQSFRRTQISWVAKRDTVLHERDRVKVIGPSQRAITLMSEGSGEQVESTVRQDILE